MILKIFTRFQTKATARRGVWWAHIWKEIDYLLMMQKSIYKFKLSKTIKFIVFYWKINDTEQCALWIVSSETFQYIQWIQS